MEIFSHHNFMLITCLLLKLKEIFILNAFIAYQHWALTAHQVTVVTQ